MEQIEVEGQSFVWITERVSLESFFAFAREIDAIVPAPGATTPEEHSYRAKFGNNVAKGYRGYIVRMWLMAENFRCIIKGRSTETVKTGGK